MFGGYEGTVWYGVWGLRGYGMGMGKLCAVYGMVWYGVWELWGYGMVWYGMVYAVYGGYGPLKMVG